MIMRQNLQSEIARRTIAGCYNFFIALSMSSKCQSVSLQKWDVVIDEDRGKCVEIVGESDGKEDTWVSFRDHFDNQTLS